MNDDSRSRKWQITINNPLDKGYTDDSIKNILSEFKNIVYYCFSYEIGIEGTHHLHLYLACAQAVRFSTLLNRFTGGHFEMCKGTSAQNRDYVFKLGKWETNEKGTTNILDSHFEFGELPVERQGARNDLADLYDMVKSGMTNFEILEICPDFCFKIDKIDRLRQELCYETNKDKKRFLKVTYLYGAAGTGKTSYVLDMHGMAGVYRITDYKNPWDGYKGQKVVLFDEFRSSVMFSEMLNWLDIYSTDLRARFFNKSACFEEVYIASNIDLWSQYVGVQQSEPESWPSFLRRIHSVFVFDEFGHTEYPLDAYLNGFIPCRITPFDNYKKSLADSPLSSSFLFNKYSKSF